jgi:transcription elongation factor Elf1
MPQIEILCPACGAESLLKRTPRYENFKKVGEDLSCASCGHPFASEAEVPFKAVKKASVFDESDAPKAVRVFREDEQHKACRYCRHYIVNPFTQRCGRHLREVEATDICGDFEPREIRLEPLP